MENWETYPIVFITHDGNAWDPNTSHFAENKATILDSNGLIIEHDTWPPQVLFMEADLGKLYSKPDGWEEFKDAINLVYTSDSISQGWPLPEDKVVKLNAQEIFAKLASLGKKMWTKCLCCINHRTCPFVPCRNGNWQHDRGWSLLWNFWNYHNCFVNNSVCNNWGSFCGKVEGCQCWTPCQSLVHPAWWCCAHPYGNDPISQAQPWLVPFQECWD